MNPLPALDLLDPPESVFDQNDDDLVALIAPEQSSLESFIRSLGDQQNTATSGLASYSSALDQADAAISAIGSIFDQITASQEAIDLSGIIEDFLASESEFADQVNFDQVDLGGILQGVFNDIGTIAGGLVQILADAVFALIAAMQAFMQHLLLQIEIALNNLSNSL